MNEYVKAALQTFLFFGGLIAAFLMAMNFPKLAGDIMALALLSFLAVYIIFFTFHAFVDMNQRKSGTYKEPNINDRT